jgi:hypothetical protein
MYYFPAPLISGYISSGNNFVYCAFRVVILVLLLLLSGAELCHLCPLIVNGYVFKNSKNQWQSVQQFSQTEFFVEV